MTITPDQAVSLICDNQAIVKVAIGWLIASIPASALAWASAHWNLLPPWAHRLLQLIALNFLSAAKGEPTPPPALAATPPGGGT